jgi:class 3 adenylate cyclase/tetratricopeptide (TPR) repeat protein
VQICPNCGEENPDRFRLCGICGTRLAAAEVAAEVRRTVTVVFSDLKGSTSLGEQLDTESLREVLNLYFNEMRTVLERHGGTVEKYIGDAIMAVFGLPRVHEDDALRAVRAAHEMKLTLEKVNERLEAGWGVRLENRTGVNTGEVVAGDVSVGQRLVTGDTVNTAARLEQAAPALEILIGESTYRLVRDAVNVAPVEPLELKGKAERVPAYLLRSVTTREGVARRLDSPMVGRTGELAELMRALQKAEQDRRAQLVTVFGPAGVGKSRLLHEFLARAGGRVRTLTGRCLSYGEGITFWPLAEITREAAGIGDEDTVAQARDKVSALLGPDASDVAERLSGAIGLSETAFPVGEITWAAGRLLETVAASKPAVVLIDDIHWAEATFLELLRTASENAHAPVVLVCSSRPELLEDHAEWILERDNVTPIVLEPLTVGETTAVIENLLGTASFDERARRSIIDAAQGNPLFVEQILTMLVTDGVLRRDEAGRWTLPADATLDIPPSISALLSARLDRLGSTERTVIDRGAVVGQTFFRGAVEVLSPEGVRPRVGTSLDSLTEKDFIRPQESTFAGQETFRFVHILIRDAAYHGLLKRTRAELHERFVDWLEEVASTRVMEYEEIRGYHLEQAFLIRVQLGPIDDRTRHVGLRAGAYLESAGHRALARGDVPAAASLLQRAASVLPNDDARRPRLLLLAGEALFEQGEPELADAAIARAAGEAASLEDEATATAARLVSLEMHYLNEGEGAEEKLLQEAEAAVRVLERLEAFDALVRAWRLMWFVHGSANHWGAAEQAVLRLIETARAAGDHTTETRALPWLAMCALYGPMSVRQAIERCEEILAAAGADRKTEADALNALAQLDAMQGFFDRARERYRRGRALLEELGWRRHAAISALDAGMVELIADDPVAAEHQLQPAYETLGAMGDHNYISTVAGLLGEALYRQQRYEDAARYAEICRTTAAADDITSQVWWRCVSGKVLVATGDSPRGEALIREAVELVRGEDDLNMLGDTFLDLATVLDTSDRIEEALVAAKEALAAYEEKGNIVSVTRARTFLTSPP